MKTALVTGGAGLLGSHLCEKLLAEGWRVYALDNLQAGLRKNVPEGAKLIQADVRDEKRWRYSVADVIFHLAATVGVERVTAYPYSVLRGNLEGTDAVIQAARRWNSRIVFASSSEVYGDRPVGVKMREDDPVGPFGYGSRWAYAECKAVEERLLTAAKSEHGVGFHIARIFGSCGRRQSREHALVLPSFIEQAFTTGEILVYGGDQVRSLLHASDTAEALYLIATEGLQEGIYNVGSGQPIRIADLALVVAEAVNVKTGSRPKITVVDAPRERTAEGGDARYRLPNVERLEALGWKREVSLADIVREYVDEYALALAA